MGGGVNMALIILGPSLIPPPAGVDVNSAESLGKAMHLFEPRHFIMPFLAHAVGTLAGALAAYLPMAWVGIRMETRVKQGDGVSAKQGARRLVPAGRLRQPPGSGKAGITIR